MADNEIEKNSNMSNEIKDQEDRLRSRYGNIDKRKGNSLLMKKLQGNNKKYFDSGDYNMANKLTKPTLANTPLANKNAIPVPKPIQDPADLPQAVRRESTTTEISPQNLAALQQRRGSQSTLAQVSN